MNLRRALARPCSGVGHGLIRLARAIYVAPQERRVEAWYRRPESRPGGLDYDLGESSRVLDLGGYQGQWASDVVARYGCTVDVFEPVPEFAAAIAHRFRRNPRVRVHDFGLGSATREAQIAVQADGSSLYRKGGPSVPVRIIGAADFFRSHRIERVDLIKINIEGGEYELLEHLLDEGLVPRIHDLLIQFHDFMPDAERRMKDIQRRLAATHELTFQVEFVWENWRRRSGNEPRAAKPR